MKLKYSCSAARSLRLWHVHQPDGGCKSPCRKFDTDSKPPNMTSSRRGCKTAPNTKHWRSRAASLGRGRCPTTLRRWPAMTPPERASFCVKTQVDKHHHIWAICRWLMSLRHRAVKLSTSAILFTRSRAHQASCMTVRDLLIWFQHDGGKVVDRSGRAQPGQLLSAALIRQHSFCAGKGTSSRALGRS